MSIRNRKLRIIALGISFILLILLSGCVDKESEPEPTPPIFTRVPEEKEIEEGESCLLIWEFNETEPSHYVIYVDGTLVRNITLNSNRIEYTFREDSSGNYSIFKRSR